MDRMEEMLRETRSRVRVGGGWGKGFWQGGVRQGYPASPVLFNILMADLEEEMNKVKVGRNKAKREEDILAAICDDVN